MIVTRTLDHYRAELKLIRTNPDIKLGFFPTMGYLHEGHASLISAARNENDYVVVSIFVNPTQFGPDEDFDAYPRNEGNDIQLCAQLGTDIVIIPDVAEMYPLETLTVVSVSKLSDSLCGHYRPGHFDGVTTIVSKLFNLVQPDVAYFGQKDAQQVTIIQRMVKELLFPIKIQICPTIREPDGLAMSSRNIRLKADARQVAPLIYKGLYSAAEKIKGGLRNVSEIIDVAGKVMKQSDKLVVQYIECRDRIRLKPLDVLDQPAILATAVFIDNVRLIDNIFLNPSEASDA
ncbi:pantoate--beta-alanine ligase [bacterium]|nr:pantoate--beta-alanine ligase [bacterium]